MLILITGPQGSGKTKLAKHLSSLLKNESFFIFDGWITRTDFDLSQEEVIFFCTNTEVPKWVLEYPNLIHFTMPTPTNL